MNLAAILPRFPNIGLPLPARRQQRSAGVSPPERRVMARHGISTLENRPLQLRVVRGCVWITRDGCPADMVLGAGEIFEHRAGAPVLIQALEDAELSVADAGSRIQNV